MAQRSAEPGHDLERQHQAGHGDPPRLGRFEGAHDGQEDPGNPGRARVVVPEVDERHERAGRGPERARHERAGDRGAEVACQPVDAERREQAVKHGVDREVDPQAHQQVEPRQWVEHLCARVGQQRLAEGGGHGSHTGHAPPRTARTKPSISGTQIR